MHKILPHFYIPHRLDRNTHNGVFFSKRGGILIGIKNCIKCEILYENEVFNLDGTNFIFVASYISSGSSLFPLWKLDSSYLWHRQKMLKNENLFVIGDFNLPHVNWIIDSENSFILIASVFGSELEWVQTESIASNGLYIKWAGIL